MSIKKGIVRYLRGWLPEDPFMHENRLKSIRKPVAVLLTVTILVASVSLIYFYSVVNRPLPPKLPEPLPTEQSTPSPSSPALTAPPPSQTPTQPVQTASPTIHPTPTQIPTPCPTNRPADTPKPTPNLTPTVAPTPTPSPTPVPVVLQGSEVVWGKTYGGNKYDEGYAVVQATDGGYAVLGDWLSPSGGPFSIGLTKTDENGTEQLTSRLMGSHADVHAKDIVQTSDGGYAITGYSYYTITPGHPPQGHYAFLIRFSENCSFIGSTIYEWPEDEEGSALVQSADGGFAVAGQTSSWGAGDYDMLLIKTNATGGLLWNKTYGGAGTETTFSMAQTSDAGYILAGSTNSSGFGGTDVFLVKTDAFGNMSWSKTYGGAGMDVGYKVIQTIEGGYAVVGTTTSLTGGDNDVYLIKTDSNGNLLWSKNFPKNQNEVGTSVIQTQDNGFALVAYTNTYAAGNSDAWLIKTDANGAMQWNKTYGGSGGDTGNALTQTSDGSYVIVGGTNSFGAGNYDVWIVKVDPTKIAANTPSHALAYTAIPAAILVTGLIVKATSIKPNHPKIVKAIIQTKTNRLHNHK
jgi:hypothetical protein